MKFKPSSPLAVAATLAAALFLLAANPNNPPNGNTGAPFNNTCAQSGCHNPPNTAFNGTVVLSGLPASIQPNTTYPLTLTLTITAGAPTKAGFQLVAVQGDNTNAGDLIVTNATQTGTETSGGREYMEQRQPKVFSGGTLNWTFNWKSPVTCNGNTVKFYFVGLFANGNGNDTNDRTITASATYAFNAAVPLSVSITNIAPSQCFAPGSGTASANGSGGTQPYAYLWSNGFTQGTPSNFPAGNFTVTCTDNVGATATASVTIGGPTAPLLLNIPNMTLSCANVSVTPLATATGGTPPYTFSGPGIGASITQSGTYTATVTDAHSCTATTTFTVSGNTTPPSVMVPSKYFDCKTGVTALIAQVANPGSYAFNWTGPQGFTASIQNPMPTWGGSYMVTVTDAVNGCTGTASATVVYDTLHPIFTVTQSNLITCYNPTASLNWNIFWTSLSGDTLSMDSTKIFTLFGGGGQVAILLDYTAPNSCRTARYQVIQANQPMIWLEDIIADTITCVKPATLTTKVFPSNLNYNFAWAGPNGFSSQSPMPAATIGGVYSVTVTDPVSGCHSSNYVEVEEDKTLPEIELAVPQNLNCQRSVIQLAATLAGVGQDFSLEWTASPGGHILAGDSTLTPTVDSAGVYKLLISNDLNGCTASAEAEVKQTPPVEVKVFQNQNILCHGDATAAANASASGGVGGFGFEWSQAGAPVGTGDSLTNLAAGSYTVIATDADGCTASANVLIDQPEALVLNAAATDETGAATHDGTASASPFGGTTPYLYAWSTGETTASLSGLAPGVFTVTVTDAHGCSAAQTLAVNSFNCTLSASLSTKNVRCAGEANGSAAVEVSGGTGPFAFHWSNGSTDSVAVNLPAGLFEVTVTDAVGCLQVGAAQVEEPPVLALKILKNTPASCPENADGAAEIEASGGTGAAIFQWSNGAAGSQLTGLAPGNFTATVTDANGCETTLTVEILANDKTRPDLICPNSKMLCPGEQTSIDLIFSDNCALGGNVPVQIGGPSGPIFPLGTAKLTFQMTDQSGNTASCAFTVTVNPIPVFDEAITHDVNNAGHGDINLFNLASGQQCQFAWVGPNGFAASTQEIPNLFAGIYTVTITNQFGCDTIQTYEVQNIVPTVDPGNPAAWRVFPNPTDGFLQVETGGVKLRFAQILDAQGRVLRTFPAGEKWDVRDLPAGLFGLRIFGENGASGVLRFVRE